MIQRKTRKKPSITRPKSPKQEAASDWRTHYSFWSEKEFPVFTLERLADNIITLVKEDKTILSWNKVMLLCDVDPDHFKRLQKRSQKLADSKKFALLAIGVNREHKALNRQIDPNVMKHTQGLYDKSWAEQEDRHAELKKNIASNSGTKIIVMSEFGNKDKNPKIK